MKIINRKFYCVLLACVCGMLMIVTFASAQSMAANQITRIVVAFPPGGPVDFVARTIAEQLGKELGHQVIVDNKAGANGAIAAEYVSRAAPDASVLWLTSVGAVAINPALYDQLSYDPVRDLTPVALVVNNVEVLVVGASSPYNTGAEFVLASRKNSEQKLPPFTMASSGTGSVPHLAIEQLNDSAKINLTHIPYKGAAPAITAVLSGQVNGFFGDIPGLMTLIKSGKLKPIGIAATQRHPAFPNVKTFTEMGFADVDSDNWYAMFTSKGASAVEVKRVNAALRRTLNNEVVKAKLLASGAQPATSSSQELATLLKNDSAKWERIVKSKNIKPD